MIVYDKEQKEIVIPNGIGNINLFNNGVEAGYNQGKIDGIEEQKSKLKSIIIVNNGRYTNEDGYKAITVDVSDFNGSYDEGYKQCLIDMESNARVLNVTENGVYRSKFSDDMPPIAYTVTGVYADGTEFHSCAELNGKVFNTKIEGSINSRLEFWYKGDYTLSGIAYNVIIGAGSNDNSNTFQVRYFLDKNNIIGINLGNSDIVLDGWDDTVWHHLIVSKAEGLWIDGEKKTDFSPTNAVYGKFLINGIGYDSYGNRNANGTFGMIKIDDTTIIPTANGFLNTNTGELLEVAQDGGYTFRENDPIYGEGELYKTINVNVPDLNGSYDEGYAQGKIDGVNEQKSKLESINITENGTYRKEDGYNEVVVNVADLNGSYEEGYEQGQADVAANARVLNVTENGNYLSKYSDPIIPTTVTGIYADGTDFYSYAQLTNKVFNTKIAATENSRLEFWYKGDNENAGKSFNVIIGAEKSDGNGYEIMYNMDSNSDLRFELGLNAIEYTWDENAWHHILIAKEKEDDSWMTLWIDEVKKGSFGNIPFNPQSPFYINCTESNTDLSKNANGYFGMIKIDDTTIIPTANGFQNVNTGELLEVVKDGAYIFTENLPISPEGELYKTINVNVPPKINVKETGLKFGNSTFTEVPEWADFEGITDMSYMFRECRSLITIPLLDTSNVTNMDSTFHSCENLETIPLLDTSNVTYMNNTFWFCTKLSNFPPIDTSNVTYMSSIFSSCNSLVSLPALDARSLNIASYVGVFGYNDLPNLINFGGFLNLKCSLTNDKNLKKLPNLTYESCINVLNGLYDFTGNGETPNSDQGQLKVHQNFLDKVGDEISIGVNKGWTITA